MEICAEMARCPAPIAPDYRGIRRLSKLFRFADTRNLCVGSQWLSHEDPRQIHMGMLPRRSNFPRRGSGTAVCHVEANFVFYYRAESAKLLPSVDPVACALRDGAEFTAAEPRPRSMLSSCLGVFRRTLAPLDRGSSRALSHCHVAREELLHVSAEDCPGPQWHAAETKPSKQR